LKSTVGRPRKVDRSGRTKHRFETPCAYPSCG
jgi:hypothetical protein